MYLLWLLVPAESLLQLLPCALEQVAVLVDARELLALLSQLLSCQVLFNPWLLEVAWELTALLELNRCVLELTVLSFLPLLPLLQSLRRRLFHRLLLPVLARDVVLPAVLVNRALRFQSLLHPLTFSAEDALELTVPLELLRLAVSVLTVPLFLHQLLLVPEETLLLLLQLLLAWEKDVDLLDALVIHALRFLLLLHPLAFMAEVVLELIVLLDPLKLAVSALIALLFPLPRLLLLAVETLLLLPQLLLALVKDVDLLDALANHAPKFQSLLHHLVFSREVVLELTVPLDLLRLAARVLIAPLFLLPRLQTTLVPVLLPTFAWEKIVALLDAPDQLVLPSVSSMSSP